MIPEEPPLPPAQNNQFTTFNITFFFLKQLNMFVDVYVRTTNALNSVSSSMALITAGSSRSSCNPIGIHVLDYKQFSLLKPENQK